MVRRFRQTIMRRRRRYCDSGKRQGCRWERTAGEHSHATLGGVDSDRDDFSKEDSELLLEPREWFLKRIPRYRLFWDQRLQAKSAGRRGDLLKRLAEPLTKTLVQS